MMDMLALSHAPDWVVTIVDAPAFRIAARVLLTSAYWVSGLMSLFGWRAAVAEERSFHLRPPAPFAALTIAVKLVGSALVIGDILLWLGAGMLAAFTFAAMLIAYPFWRPGTPQRSMLLISFCEHLGLIAGFMLVTLASTIPLGSVAGGALR